MTVLKEHYSFAWNRKLLWCCYRILKSKTLYSRGKKSEKKWSPFTLDVAIDEQNLFVNLYNVNMEKYQRNTINDLIEMLKSVSNISA